MYLLLSLGVGGALEPAVAGITFVGGLLFVAGVIVCVASFMAGLRKYLASQPTEGFLPQLWRPVYDKLAQKYKVYYEGKLGEARRQLRAIEERRKKLTEEADIEHVLDSERDTDPSECIKAYIQWLYDKLPEDLQEALFSEELAEEIRRSCALTGVGSYEKNQQVSKYTGHVMLGLIPPNRLEEALEIGAKLGRQEASEVACAIKNSVFPRIKVSLERMYSSSTRSVPWWWRTRLHKEL